MTYQRRTTLQQIKQRRNIYEKMVRYSPVKVKQERVRVTMTYRTHRVTMYGHSSIEKGIFHRTE